VRSFEQSIAEPADEFAIGVDSISGIDPRWMTKMLPLELKATPDVPRKFAPGGSLNDSATAT
jgi:hypothetical protein